MMRTSFLDEYRDRQKFFLNHHQKFTKMKKYATSVAASLLLYFIFQSCRKETVHNVPKYESLRNLPNAAEMRIAFIELTSAEKASFWKYNIKKNIPGMTPSQKTIVMDLYQKLSPAVYENGTSDNITFKTLFVPDWLKKAETIFSKSKIWEMFYFLEGEQIAGTINSSYSLDQVPQSQIAAYDESAPNCLCNIGSSYSCKKREISVGTSGANIKEIYGSCTYSRNAYVCDRDDYGCGFMSAWACNGNLCTY
jgi:hypothetical protein